MAGHFLDFGDLTLGEWMRIYNLADDISNNMERYSERCRGKILATLFYESSTRTVFSFQTAALRLGGNYIGFSGTAASSVSKGENLRDTIKIVANYADIIAIRHHCEGASYASALYSNRPVINAGDGAHLHPTQTMLDLFAIQKLYGKYKGMKIAFCGDLKYNRTVHSLLRAFELFENNDLYFISTPELSIPEKYIKKLKDKNRLIFRRKIEDCIKELDIIYMTRIQKERFPSPDEYARQKDVYVLDRKKLDMASKDLIILHPLPKVDEIASDIDDDPRARYFKQAEYGLYVRMALIITLLEGEGVSHATGGTVDPERICKNERCITQAEKYLPHLFKGKICAYCEYESEV